MTRGFHGTLGGDWDLYTVACCCIARLHVHVHVHAREGAAEGACPGWHDADAPGQPPQRPSLLPIDTPPPLSGMTFAPSAPLATWWHRVELPPPAREAPHPPAALGEVRRGLGDEVQRSCCHCPRPSRSPSDAQRYGQHALRGGTEGLRDLATAPAVLIFSRATTSGELHRSRCRRRTGTLQARSMAPLLCSGSYA
jgi:hypothetical protein